MQNLKNTEHKISIQLRWWRKDFLPLCQDDYCSWFSHWFFGENTDENSNSTLDTCNTCIAVAIVTMKIAK